MKALYFLIILGPAAPLLAGPFSEFAVTAGLRSQAPDLDEFGNLVWQQWYQDGSSGDWDVYRMDLNGTEDALLVADWTGNQTAPSVYDRWVVFEDEYAAGDHDIYVRDTSLDLDPNTLAATALDERAPDVHGNTAVWQHLYVDDVTGDSDWDIVAADFTDAGSPQNYDIAFFSGNQQAPALYRTTVVWQDAYYGDPDIFSADTWLKMEPAEYPVSANIQDQEQPAIWRSTVVWAEDSGGGDWNILAANMDDPENPDIFPISEHAAAQTQPDIWKSIVVWQDNRNGNWDIYGYNLITKKEFRITDDPANQTDPAIGGGYVAWVDLRDGFESVYAAYLDGSAAATCDYPPAGDANGDCKADLADLLALSEGWLACGLAPSYACAD